ncbi:hypothetical protein B0T26DRAFT_873683 [Lasiosphaeria miniovina]|uniref:FAD-binding PCMH-type domain-containing protein n=1 Tax=Lasiosphaeria miniovina TaxID=1954250 RepID=A0AA40ACW1_9PEZI|nr:uncharacterized protein B0T26DRAFT_873683 [Lasiosphaeria miniovina]KAK0713564.1 hypothetical protein B0T26DRAFT_873683 [Lasiosphaeria miniovina]
MRPDLTWQKVLSATAAVATTRDSNITDIFGPVLSARASIHLPSDANYTSCVTQRWSSHAAPPFIGTIRPATVEDVQNTVKIAAAHNIPFLATGGGHGVSIQMAALRDGIQIDLAKFNSVHLDTKKRLLTVGGAAKFSDLIKPVDEAGAQFPLGSAYCVGVLGATLGAGVSANQGYAGLLADLLDEVQLVTAAGRLVTASRTQYADLFWALRGAGANFGIVTSATFRLPETVNKGNVTNANFLFPAADKAAQVYGYLASLDDNMSALLALNIGTFLDPGSKQLMLLVNANFAGPPDEAAPYLAALSDLQPLRSEVLNVRWPDVFATSYFGIPDTKACGRNQHVNMRSVGARRTDAAALVAFLGALDRFSRAHPGVFTAMMIHRFPNQKVREVPDGDSVYPYRDLKMHIQLESEYEDLSETQAVEEFLRAARRNLAAASGYASPAVYVNFAHGDEGPAAWYGERNLQRLRQLKRKWDPRGLFGFYNAVPTAGGTSDGDL